MRAIAVTLIITVIVSIAAPVVSAAESDGAQHVTTMSYELREQIDEHLVGEWTWEGTWGDKTLKGEVTTRWTKGKTAVLTQGYTIVDGQKTTDVYLLGWDGTQNALIGRGFSSDGSTGRNCWTDLSEGKWTGHGSGNYMGRPWESEITLELMKDKTRYHDITHGKPFVAVYTRKRVPTAKSEGIPQKALDAMQFFVGKWVGEGSENGEKIEAWKDERKWAPGKHCITITATGTERGVSLDYSAICGWDAKGQQLVEHWYLSDGLYVKICYPVARMEGDVWRGSVSLVSPDGTQSRGSCRLNKTNAGYAWTCRWTEDGKQMVRESVSRRVQ